MFESRFRRLGLARGDLPVAVLAGAAGVLGSYAVAGLTAAFLAGPIAGFIARTMPGVIVTIAILVLRDLGEALTFVSAVALAVLLLTGTTAMGIAVARRAGVPAAAAPLTGVLAWLVAVAVTGAPLAALGTGIGAGVVVAAAALGPMVSAAPAEVSRERRRLLGGLAGLLTLGVIGVLVQRRPDGAATSDEQPADADVSIPGATEEDRTVIRDRLAEAAGKSLDVGGIEPLVSERFYEVDINPTGNPNVPASNWSLTFTGEVERRFAVTYDDLTAMPAEHRFVTLRCVGEALNGQKMDNALWTGVPIADFVEEAGPRGGCECVMLRAEDGYFEEFPLAALRRGFLAYGMNGQPLPRRHGYPVRALIPGHWGEINVKWLTEVEVLDRELDGYWEMRGWHGTGPVNTVAKLHAVNRLPGGRVQVGGHAYAGTRGIDRVEVAIDGGDWQQAVLSEPLPGEDVWRQWKYEYRPPAREHDVVVRAVDGEGAVQPEEQSRSFPSGPTGWVSRTVEP